MVGSTVARAQVGFAVRAATSLIVDCANSDLRSELDKSVGFAYAFEVAQLQLNRFGGDPPHKLSPTVVLHYRIVGKCS